MKIVPYLKDERSQLHPLPVSQGESDVFLTYTHSKEKYTGLKTKYFSRTVFRLEDDNGAPIRSVRPEHLVMKYGGGADTEDDFLIYQANSGCWEQKNDRSVNSAGAYQVDLFRKEDLTVSLASVRLRVMPSNVSYGDYRIMLNDLVRIHEDLLHDLNSSVNAAIRTEEETEPEQADRLADLIRRVMSLPSEAQKKQYTRVRADRLKRMDARVARDLARHGDGGKVLSITYQEDHDTYENRVIRYVLEQLRQQVMLWEAKDAKETLRNMEQAQEEERETLDCLTNSPDLRNISLQNTVRNQMVQSQRNRMDSLQKQSEQEEAIRQSVKRLTQLLTHPWFRDISPLSGLDEIRLTSKFRYHRLYHPIYELLRTIIERHPVISYRLDTPSLGLNPTHMIYEYWVFYKIVDHLRSLGFRIKSDEGTTLEMEDYFRSFIQNTSGHKKSGLILNLEKELDAEGMCIKLTVFYEHKFWRIGKRSKGDASYRKPDYAILVRINGRRHWYFLDAKYKPFAADGPNDYHPCLQDVAINHYIREMKEILASEGDSGEICGSYLIAPGVAETAASPSHDLSENNRLFGSWEEFCGHDQAEHKYYPAHRYGIIRLSPSCGGELVTLFQMIFEFIETGHNQESPLLNYCWRCGSPLRREEYHTIIGKSKYHSTCTHCGTFRVDTHCFSCGNKLIVKHTAGNYHRYDHSSKSWKADLGRSWAYLCPLCGRGLT